MRRGGNGICGDGICVCGLDYVCERIWYVCVDGRLGEWCYDLCE